MASFFILLSLSVFSQNEETIRKPEMKRYYKLTDFNFSYSGSIYNFSSIYLDHAHDLYDFASPVWEDTDSMLSHDNRSEINARINFRKQLMNDKSYFYGNLSVGVCMSTGGRIKASYMSDYYSHTDSATINGNPVTNLDTLIIKQNNYTYSSTDLGIDISYTISSPPKYTFTGEAGIGFSGMSSVDGKMFFTDSETINHKYLDQFNRNQNFIEDTVTNSSLKPASQTIIRAYIPLILSYKMGHNGNLALMTKFTGGIEFQKPQNGSFYSYTYFTIGVGCRYYF